MKERIVDDEIMLIPYYPDPETTLPWYQDPALVKQVDNVDEPYTAEKLGRMYSYLSTHGECFYIRYRGALAGDVTLRDNAEICIVVAPEYQNRHIGRRCIADMLALAAEKGFSEVKANIYSFNMQSRRMFEAAGFTEMEPEWFSCRLPVTDVYIARIPDTVAYEPVLPKERQEQIDATDSDAVKAQRYRAWEVLLNGLEHSYGLDAETAGLTKDERGRWSSAVCGISLSHCRTAVAAAVSNLPVGIDIEPAEDVRYRQTLIDRIANDVEKAMLRSLPERLRVPYLWTRKEAAFKRSTDQTMPAIKQNATDRSLRTVLIRLDTEYMLSVACEASSVLRLFEFDHGIVRERTDFITV